MRVVLCRSTILQFGILFGMISVLCLGNLGAGSSSTTPVAYAMQAHQGQSVTASSCPRPQAPTQQSILVVLLDRSTSLTQTDPGQYSASVTKILADLWPGSMAVLLMSGGGDALQYLGPERLSNPDAQRQLKDEIEQRRNQLGAYTPLAKTMDKAFDLLSQNGFPAGSRAVLITDGLPSVPGDLDGKLQTQDIEQRIIPEFCNQGIPINAFGLSIDDTNANTLLRDITEQTGAASFLPYRNVTDPASLGEAVISLYAKWRGLTLVPIRSQNEIFSMNIDTYAKQAYIVTFHSSNKLLPLLGPDHQDVPEAAFQQYSTDTHYEFYNLSGKQFSTSGQYTVNASSDPRASVYRLEGTRLQITIVSPTSQTPIYEGQPLTVTAAFYDGNTSNHVHLNPNQGSMEVICTLSVNGRSTPCGEETLNQQPRPTDDLFSNQITPPQLGTLTITVIGTVQDVPIEGTPSITLQIQEAPCGTNIRCYWERYHTQVLGFGIPLLLLLLLLFWRSRPSPFGTLQQTLRSTPVVLGEGRSLRQKLFKKSVISSHELQGDFPAFVQVSFDLVFHRGGVVNIKAKRGSTHFKVGNRGSLVEVQPGDRSGVLLSDGNTIYIGNQPTAIFKQ